MEGLPILEEIVKFIQEVPEAVVFIIAGAVDFVLRMVKSDKPKSIAWAIVAVLKQISKAAEVAAGFLDKVLPQRVNDVVQVPDKP